MIKHIVIAGGSGFIGTSLVNILHSSGYKVYILSRKEPKIFPKYSRIQWDAKTIGLWSEVIEGAECIIQLTGANVGAKRWSKEYKKEIFDSRIDSTLVLVSAVNNATVAPKTFISTSGVGFYGNVSKDIICEEDSKSGTDFLATVCFEWEKATEHIRKDVRSVILRIGVVLDPNEGALSKIALPYKFFVGGTLGNGSQVLSWIHRDDLLNIFTFALENEKLNGVFNATAPNPITMEEFCKTIGKVLDRPSIFPVPTFVLKLLLGEMSGIVLMGQNAPPRKLEAHTFKYSYQNIEPAIRNLLQ